MRVRKTDKYRNFAALEAAEPKNAWRIHKRIRDPRVLIIAPHGGRIEPGTSPLAARIAGNAYSLYQFEGLKPPGQNGDLHITSHRFDQRDAVAMAEKSSITLGIHGCNGVRAIFVGGLDTALRDDLTIALVQAGFRATSRGHHFPAAETNNVCNRGSRGGAQLEITLDLRMAPAERARIARVAREVLAQHLAALKRADAQAPVDRGGR